MRIAMVSTPFLPVPPPKYGGTELVVWELAEGLRDAGHEVTLFTAGPSRTRAEARRLLERPLWPPEPYAEIEHAAWAVGEIALGEFDVVHAHVAAALPLARFVEAPVVYTIHHERDEALTRLYGRARGVQLVAISHRQRQLLPELDGVAVVWHGLDPRRYPLGDGEGRSALFLGRFAREKGPHVALDVAAAAGVPIRLAGQPHWRDEDYFHDFVKSRLGQYGVHWCGELGHDDKCAELCNAAATLLPIDWEEPFGLVIAESMLCGTPVLAFRRGSAPELVEHGVTGWLCDDAADMAGRLWALVHGGLAFDRARCRARAIERFGRARMVHDYVDVYERAMMRLLHHIDAPQALPV